MPVRFVIGRAGAGKTAHCLKAICTSLRASPLEGPRLVLLVPEQASLQMERALLERLDGSAAHRAEVLSFRRLAFRVLNLCGDGGRSALSPAARAMVLRLLLSRNASALRYYKRARHFSGFVDKLGRTMTEFIEESISPQDLEGASAANDDPIRALKLHDLGVLYKAYIESLGATRMDPSQFLDVARDRLTRCDWLAGAHVYVDGFAGFSRQEQLMLVTLAQTAEHMDITAMIDADYASDPTQSFGSAYDLFATTRRMIAELVDRFGRHDIDIGPPLELRAAPRRFAKCPALAHLEAHLFAPAPDKQAPTAGIRVVQASDRRTEVEFAVSQIVAHVQRPGVPLRGGDALRYRDIAVIVRDLEPYHALLSAALRARGIPFFIDRRRPTDHHPLVLLLRGALELASGDYEIEPVRTMLKTGLVGLDDESADELENHLLATGVAGRERWAGGDWPVPPRDRSKASESAVASTKRVNAAREHFLQRVDAWVVSASNSDPLRGGSPLRGGGGRTHGVRPVGFLRGGGATTGAVWAERLRDMLGHLNVREQIERWASDADDDGNLDLGEAHRQIVRDVDQFLEDLESAFGGERVEIATLASVVDAAFAQLTVGLAPPMLDQVLVGSIERSRHPDVKLALVLGCNEGVFPAIAAEESILNDDDRAWLNEQGVRLGTPRTRRIIEESLLYYVAVTRPSESLIVTCALAGSSGKELRPSTYLDSLRAACPGVEIESVGDPLAERKDWAVLTASDLAANIAYEFRHRAEVSHDDTAVRTGWNGLYDSARADEELTPALASAVRALAYDNASTLSPASAASSVSDPFRASVSQLETFAACAFKHFAQYRLKLQERQLARLAPVDVGTIHHAILEKFIDGLAEHGQSMSDLDDGAILERLDESCRYVGETLPLMGELSRARDRYVMARGQHDLMRVLNSQKRVSAVGSFRPKAVEAKFGFPEDKSLPGLEIKTPAGRNVILRGIIDRVDLAEVSDELLGVVVDYKRSTDRRLDLSHVYYGLSLQLLGYLLVLAQRGETLAGRPIKPAGAFYVNLLHRYKRVEHPQDAEDFEAGKLPHRPRGLLDVARMPALVRDPPPAGWSPTYSVFRAKAGGIGHIDKSDAAESDAFAGLLAHTYAKIGELADQVLDGEVAVKPCRLGSFSPCSWCAFKSLCRFEPRETPIRFFGSLKRSEVFQRLIGGRREASDG